MKTSVFSIYYMFILAVTFGIGACTSKTQKPEKAMLDKSLGTQVATNELPNTNQKKVIPATNWPAIEMSTKAAEMNLVVADVNSRAQGVELLQLSSNDLSQHVLAAIAGGDMVVIKRLWENLRSGGNYDLALHLATNALAIAKTAVDKACCATMTLEVSVGSSYDKDEDQGVAEHALDELRNVTPDLSPEEKELRWSIASVAYCSICSAVYKDIDKALRSIEFVEEYIKNKSRAAFQRDSAYRNIASQLSLAKPVACIRMSETSSRRLRAYADSIDESYIPACVKSLPITYDVGERKLKLLIMRGLERYENERTKVSAQTQQ
jgi:hypothetical protein